MPAKWTAKLRMQHSQQAMRGWHSRMVRRAGHLHYAPSPPWARAVQVPAPGGLKAANQRPPGRPARRRPTVARSKRNRTGGWAEGSGTVRLGPQAVIRPDQASYLGPDGQRRMPRKPLIARATPIAGCLWWRARFCAASGPTPLGRVPFAESDEWWIKEHRAGERTREQYLSLSRNHIVLSPAQSSWPSSQSDYPELAGSAPA